MRQLINRKLLFVMFAVLAVAGSALATTTGGGFDPAAMGSDFVTQFGTLLADIAPVVISILMVGLAFKLVMKYIRRGTKV